MEVIETVGVIEMIDRLAHVDVGLCDQPAVKAVLADTSRVQRWLDAVKVTAARRLRELAAVDATVFPEGAAADATRGSQHETDTLFKRADTTNQIPQLADALDNGTVSGAHLDVVTRALHGLEPADRALLTNDGDWLTALAARLTPDEFTRAVRRYLNRIRSDDGVARFQRQRRATRLRTWTDRDTGMICIRGEFDPETGLAFLARIDTTLDTLFHDTTPDTCPTDPQAKQEHLRALALLALSEGNGPRGRPDITIVIDHDTIVNGRHHDSHIDCGHPDIHLPIDTIRRLGCSADITLAHTDRNGVVLNIARTQRLANRHQRRALRVMYPTCAVPGCNVRYQHCQPHHILWWRNGGTTDLANLLPLCNRHHHLAHEGGWHLTLHPTTRTLTITQPDNTTTTTGPPNTRAG